MREAQDKGGCSSRTQVLFTL